LENHGVRGLEKVREAMPQNHGYNRIANNNKKTATFITSRLQWRILWLHGVWKL